MRRAALSGNPILLQGPRGSGKTTLLRSAFPAHSYITLEDVAERTSARSDPGSFVARLRGPVVLDDVHRVPELLRHIEGPRALVMGSALRLSTPFETLELFPPTQAEREGRPSLPIDMLGRFQAASPGTPVRTQPPFVPTRTWLDRDVRALINVQDLDRFEMFAAAAQARSGEVLDQQTLADECGVSHRTVTRWLGVLDTCFRTLRLPPCELDFGRRLVRSPKLHFLESEVFESRVVYEIYRNVRHAGLMPNLSYWRDSNGFEIPLIIQTETAAAMPVQIAAEPNPPGLARLRRWMELAGVRQGAIITAGGRQLLRKDILSYPFEEL